MAVILKKKVKYLDQKQFLKILDQFIRDSENGIRTYGYGKKVSPSTIRNYVKLKKTLIDFSNSTAFEIRIYIVTHLSEKEFNFAANYWKKFTTKFLGFLYNEKGAFDNYVGTVIRRLRSVINYISEHHNIQLGSFHKRMMIPKDEIDFVVLSPDQLKRLIHDKKLDDYFSDAEKRAKDIFVFGCLTGLRYSDLVSLQKENIQVEGENFYLTVKSKKTNTATRIKLPVYALNIIKKYHEEGSTLLPKFSNAYLNMLFKSIGKKLFGKERRSKIRNKQGQPTKVFKDKRRKTNFYTSDLISTHTMRRTGITTMLRLGVPEHVVRKFSGHSANSKEFFRYVQVAQGYLNAELDKAYLNLEQEENGQNHTK